MKRGTRNELFIEETHRKDSLNVFCGEKKLFEQKQQARSNLNTGSLRMKTLE